MTQLAGKGGVSTKKTKQNNAHNEFAPDKWTVDDDPITIGSQKQADDIKPLPETAHGLQKACHLACFCDFFPVLAQHTSCACCFLCDANCGFFGFLLLGIGSVYWQLPAVSICLIQFGYQMFPVSPNINVTLGAAKGLIDDLIDKIVVGTPRTQIQAKVMRNHSFLYM